LDTINPIPSAGANFTSAAFPPTGMTPLKLYFDASSRKLMSTRPAPSCVQYQANKGEILFTYQLSQDSVLCGPVVAKLAVSLRSADNSDIFINLEKLGQDGNVGDQLCIPYERNWQSHAIRAIYRFRLKKEVATLFYKGPRGQLRLSRRLQSTGHQVPGFPTFRMDISSPIIEDEIIPVQVPMLPMGMQFSKGETIRVRVSGIDRSVFPPVDQATLTVNDIKNVNASGVVSLHTGLNKHESSLELPMISSSKKNH
jgi:uncharacterized protein